MVSRGLLFVEVVVRVVKSCQKLSGWRRVEANGNMDGEMDSSEM